MLLTPALVPLPNEDVEGQIAGEVLWVDHYGNCQLNVAPEQLEEAGAHVGDALEVTVSDAAGVHPTSGARWVRTFAEAKPSELVVLVDSYGMCTLALDRRSAAGELGRSHEQVTVAWRHRPRRPIRRRGVPIGLGRRDARS